MTTDIKTTGDLADERWLWTVTAPPTQQPERGPLHLTVNVAVTNDGNRIQFGKLGRNLNPVEAAGVVSDFAAAIRHHTEVAG